MNVPDTLKYTKEHEWVRIDSESSTDDSVVVYVGITDFAQGELGDIVFVEVDTVGDTLAKDEIFGTVEAVKTTSDLFMPVSGEILEFNPAIDEDQEDNPALINEDPHGEAWLIKVKLSEPAQLEDLMDAESYRQLIE